MTDFLKTSKQAHHHKYFEENKKNWIVYCKNKNKTSSP